MLNTNQKVLGDINVSRKGSLTLYSINCYLEKPSRVNCILLDKLGVTLWEQNSSQPRGQSSIDIQVPPLRAGEYNCWVKIAGHTYLRPLKITGNKKKRLLNQWMDHFS